jgi:GNAT superfamily N-acetyltransferase
MALIFRTANAEDVVAIVALLADDPLGQGRESANLALYLAAFAEIEATPVHQLIVGEMAGEIVATCQLTILSGLSHQGGKRALVEAVRTAAHLRSQGIGAALMAECEARARAAGATMIQLTTDKSRSRAHMFYSRAGYAQSHLGFKKKLD